MMLKPVLIAASALAVLGLTGASAADDPIATRQGLMKSMGKAAQAGGQMVKGEAEFDPVTADLVFRTMNAVITGFPHFFPEGSESGGDTAAKPEIWTDRQGFLAKATALREATAKAIAAPAQDLDSFKVTFAAVTENCGGCHELYRVKKD